MKKTALEKRIKRNITGREHSFFAACSPGFKNLCNQEMLAAGFSTKQPTQMPGGIEFIARPDQAMVANLHLRSPLRILMRIAQFKATSFEQLEKKVKNMDWAIYLPADCQLDLHVTCKKSRLYHSDAIAQRVEKHIFNHPGINPKTNSDQSPIIGLYIRVDNDRFVISIDTTGDHLFKRGIKKKITTAPLRENIAAAMLIWANLTKDDILIDPMCGSGTFSLEAAMIKSNIPSGFYRNFTFESLPGFSNKTFSHLKKEVVKQVYPIQGQQIFASDMDDKAVAALKKNVSGHDFLQTIDIQNCDFFSILPNKLSPAKKGIITLNPPYGKRLEHHSNSQSFYKDVMHKMRADFKGWRLAIILPSKKDMVQLNLKLDHKPVFHGGMDACVGIGVI